MGRQPKIRASYSADAQYLLRLANAVERDNKRTPKWRGRLAEMINALAMEFLKVPSKTEE